MPKRNTRKAGRGGTAHPKSGSGARGGGTVSGTDDSASPPDAPAIPPGDAPPGEAERPTRTPEPSIAPPVPTVKKRGRARQEEIAAERDAATAKESRDERERIEREAKELTPEVEDTLDCVFGVMAGILGEHWELEEKERAKLALRFGRVYAKRGAGSAFLSAWSAELALAGSLSVVFGKRIFGRGTDDDADTHDTREPGEREEPTGPDAVPREPAPHDD